MSKSYYFRNEGTITGPVTARGMRRLARQGGLQPGDLVWLEEMKQWVPASRLKGLFPAVRQAASVAIPAPVVVVDEEVPVLEFAEEVPVLEPALTEEAKPKGLIDRLCQWIADKLTNWTGQPVSASCVKAVGGLMLLAWAAKALLGGGGSGSGTPRSGGQADRLGAHMDVAFNAACAGKYNPRYHGF